MAQYEDRAYTLYPGTPYTLLTITIYSTTQVVQLTSLRPNADLFCALLRDSLKVELQRGQMKLVKPFTKTSFSEILVAQASDDEKEAAAARAEDANAAETMYTGGLGLKFKFPGDARKCVFLHV